MINVYQSLLGTVRQAEAFPEQDTNESSQDYLQRLLQAVNNLSDDHWQMLTTEAQDWFDKNVDAFNNKQEVESPEGYQEQHLQKPLTKRSRSTLSSSPSTTVFEDMKNQWMRMQGSELDESQDDQELLCRFVEEAHASGWEPSTDAGKSWLENARKAYDAEQDIPLPQGFPARGEPEKVPEEVVHSGSVPDDKSHHVEEVKLADTKTDDVESHTVEHEASHLTHRADELHKDADEPNEAPEHMLAQEEVPANPEVSQIPPVQTEGEEDDAGAETGSEDETVPAEEAPENGEAVSDDEDPEPPTDGGSGGTPGGGGSGPAGKPKAKVAERHRRMADPSASAIHRIKKRQPRSPVDKTRLIRKLVTENERITIEELRAALLAHGITTVPAGQKPGPNETTLQTLSSTRAAHLSTLRLLREMGWAPKDLSATHISEAAD